LEKKIRIEKDIIECWNLLRAGDRKSFAHIYSFYADDLFTYGSYFSQDRDLVKDAIQELFIDIWRMRENLSATTSVKFYLFRSLRRKLHVLTETRTSFSTFDSEADLPEVISHEEEFMNRETQDGRLKQLHRLLSQLPPRQFEAIRLCYFDNFDLKETASIMQMNEQSVRNLIQRSIRHLRQLFTTIVSLFLFFYKTL